ncbi:hypothetical protein D3C85_1854630 [compost metagenome]
MFGISGTGTIVMTPSPRGAGSGMVRVRISGKPLASPIRPSRVIFEAPGAEECSGVLLRRMTVIFFIRKVRLRAWQSGFG